VPTQFRRWPIGELKSEMADQNRKHSLEIAERQSQDNRTTDGSFTIPLPPARRGLCPDTAWDQRRKSIDFGSQVLSPSSLSDDPHRSAIALDRMSPRPVPTAFPIYSHPLMGCVRRCLPSRTSYRSSLRMRSVWDSSEG